MTAAGQREAVVGRRRSAGGRRSRCSRPRSRRSARRPAGAPCPRPASSREGQAEQQEVDDRRPRSAPASGRRRGRPRSRIRKISAGSARWITIRTSSGPSARADDPEVAGDRPRQDDQQGPEGGLGQRGPGPWTGGEARTSWPNCRGSRMARTPRARVESAMTAEDPTSPPPPKDDRGPRAGLGQRRAPLQADRELRADRRPAHGGAGGRRRLDRLVLPAAASTRPSLFAAILDAEIGGQLADRRRRSRARASSSTCRTPRSC